MKKTVFLFLTFYILQIFGCFKNAKKKNQFGEFQMMR